MWLPIGLTVCVLLAAFLAVGGASLALKHGWPAILAAVGRHVAPALAAMQAEIVDIRGEVAAIPKSFESYEKEVKRLHDRAYHRVRRAREEFAQRGGADPELDQVAGELQLFDGERGAPGGVPVMPEGLAEHPSARAPEQPLTWQQRTVRYKYG